ncbi:MAG: TipAS antibiotic-recognition domain-containing protein, partial [Actinobacteria bacterium]|nr:TipAS antibiotic-recognition domain-containing protein [Actinomycetota bacterium]
LAARHVGWIQAGWGGRRPSAEAITGLAQMYVADERFAANYGGVEGAGYVRDALVLFAQSM